MASPLPSGAAADVHGLETFDAGLHADTDAGPIDVGLAVQPGLVGVVVVAPSVGRLRAAFAVSADGTTRLSTLSRLGADGSEAHIPPLVVIDEARTLELEGQLARSEGRVAELESEREEARARAAALADEKQAALKSRGELEFAIAQHQARLDALSADLELARLGRTEAEGQRAALEREFKGLRAQQGDQLAAARAAAAEAERKLEAAEEAATARAERDEERLAQLEGELRTAKAELEAAEARLATTPAETAARQALEQQLAALQEDLAARETAWNESLGQRDAALAEHQAWAATAQETNASLTAQLDRERAATEEARDVARKLQAGNAQLVAERDEARTVARSLHQQVSGAAPVEAVKAELAEARTALDKLRGEHERLQQRSEAASRQLETERSARAKVVAERDQLRDQFLALTSDAPKDNTLGADFSRDSTMPYSLDSLRPTSPEIPAVKLKGEPAVPWKTGDDKKKRG